MLIEGEINFETGIHESDLLASLVVEGGILPSAKKHYLQKGFFISLWVRVEAYEVLYGNGSQRAPRSSEPQKHLARTVPQKQEEKSPARYHLLLLCCKMVS